MTTMTYPATLSNPWASVLPNPATELPLPDGKVLHFERAAYKHYDGIVGAVRSLLGLPNTVEQYPAVMVAMDLKRIESGYTRTVDDLMMSKRPKGPASIRDITVTETGIGEVTIKHRLGTSVVQFRADTGTVEKIIQGYGSG